MVDAENRIRDQIRGYLAHWNITFRDCKKVLCEGGITVYSVTTESDPVFVILGYGPPAHYAANWQEDKTPADIVLRYYLGNLRLIELSVQKKEITGV